MVVGEASINNIMGGIENTGSVRLHNHKRKLKQRFDIIKKLGQGTYGKVQLGINKETGQEVAIKTIKKSKIETEADLIRIRREIQIMSSVQHPNIIHIYEVFENREKMVLVMEYAAGGELYDYLSERKVLVEEEARRIFRQISTACYYCHKHKICHRDLKLENILLDENRNAKIADFGLSNVFDDTRLLSTFCGSPLYASPEIVKGTPYHGPEVDCWSLGVLLYTLVYGAMPFDGSNFKRLVKQISQGDYFEPKTPSPASPLIQEMLTVNPKHRANIEKICAHWWVNEGYDESCLEISEELANQTPVRLDVLLSLNPPPSQLESDKLVVTGEVNDEQMKAESAAPARSQSVGSLMDISNPAERRIKDLITQEAKGTPKRKLETTVSSDQANVNHDGKRKEKIVKEHTVADISVQNNHSKPEQEDVKMAEEARDEKADEITDPSLQGAACAEIIEEAKKNEAKKPTKLKKAISTSVSNKILEEINENPSQESLQNHIDHDKDKENTAVAPTETVKTEVKEEKEKETKAVTPKKKVQKKKVLGDKNEIADKKEKASDVKKEVKEDKEKEKEKEVPAEPPAKPVERRQSRIFEQAERFQNRINNSSESKIVSPEKPKKIIIPGVSVGGFKKEFERKASLKSVSPPKLKATTPTKKVIIDDKQPSPPVEDPKPEPEKEPSPVKTETKPAPKVEPSKVESKEIQTQTSIPSDPEEEHKVKLKNAVSIISNALDKEGARKSKSRPCMTRKPPVPFGTNGRSASGSIGMISSPMSPPPDNKRFLKMQTSLPADSRLPLSSTPEQVRIVPEALIQPESKTSSAEITLKSATLPRRKSTKAEIQLDYPKLKPATMEFKTEMAHHVQAPPSLTTQRSEVMFPVNAPQHLLGLRSSSVEPEGRASHKERIIPIAFERPTETAKEPIMSPPAKPPVPRGFQTQKSTAPSSRSNSLSRQSTQESDSETTVSGEPIKKSPREYIIPIAVEGGGYVTPRAGSLEPSETSSTVTNSSRKTTGSKFGRPRRMMSLFDRDGSEDESPFGTLHRHSSFGKDSDTEGDSRKDAFHMHRLRSSRPRKSTVEHADSLSSGEDEDDDDAFEFLTAENLFSTLLSRVRDLTQRLNVDDGSRPGFPKSRLLSHGSNFWNRMEPMGSSRNSPLGRQFSREHSVNSTSSIPWRRSVSRDLASDIESVFSDPKRTPSATLPRGDKTDDPESLNLSDLNLKKLKLTEEDALALSYLTPGLSRRIQKQLFASLPPSEARKISRTMSMRNEGDGKAAPEQRRSVDRISSTLPRKFSFDKCNSSQQDINQNNDTNNRSYLPTSSVPYKEDLRRSRYYQRATSLREPADFKSKFHTYSLRSPDSSISEISSLKDDESYSYGPESTSLSKYLHGSHLLDTNKIEEAKPENKPARKVSRFLRPDFYDTPKEDSVVVKEKKEREMETQKVLKEIRDKRIRNRLTMRRERSQEKALEGAKTNGTPEVIKCKDLVEALNENETVSNKSNSTDLLKIISDKSNSTDLFDKSNSTDVLKIASDKSNSTDLLKIVSDNIKNIESNVMSAQKIESNVMSAQKDVKKERVSKLVRPKSYPAENGVVVKPQETKSKIGKVQKKPTSQKTKETDKSTKNKFLQSIEKKIEKLRTFSSDDKKDGGGVENTIKRLREQSVPRNVDHITESTLIKRAVSVEDFSNVKNKALQPSRKSVTKILSLFKKYEDKKDSQLENDPTVMLKNINESNIPSFKSKIPGGRDVKSPEKERPKSLAIRDVKSPERERPKSLAIRDVKSPEKERPKSLAIRDFKSPEIERPKSLGIRDVKSPDRERAIRDVRSEIRDVKSEIRDVKSEIERSKLLCEVKSPEKERPKSLVLDKKRCNGTKDEKKISKLPVNSFSRKSLNLDVDTTNNNVPEVTENGKVDRKNLKLDFSNLEDVNLNRISYTTDESSNLLSPCDETLSCDSWSVCSDYHHTQDLLSPLSPNGNMYNSGDENESVIDRIRRKSFYTRFNEKKKPRKALMGNYKDLDLYKDYNQKTVQQRYKTPDYTSSYRRSSGYSSSGEGEHDYKRYVRSKSVASDYGNSQRYQTFNPRRSNISSLYSPEDGEDLSATGTYRKYSYNPNRLGNYSRASRSPSSDFQYIPHPQHSSLSPNENSHNITEHAV